MKYRSILMCLFTLSVTYSAICYASTNGQSESALVVKGEVNDELFQRIKKFVDDGGKTIVVTSEGGDAGVGLKIGMAVVNKGITVIVRKYCLSSCANYLFLGAENKRLEPGAILGFHGGIGITPMKEPGGKNGSQLESQFAEQFAKMIDAERFFLQKLKLATRY